MTSCNSQIEELKNEHEAILETFSKIRKLGINSDDLLRELLQTKEILLNHLQKEDEMIYPVLNAVAENDHQLNRKLTFFIEDTKNITNYAFQFYSDLEKGTPLTELFKELGKLTAMLKMRISKEEKVLFPEYEKIISQQSMQ